MRILEPGANNCQEAGPINRFPNDTWQQDTHRIQQALNLTQLCSQTCTISNSHVIMVLSRRHCKWHQYLALKSNKRQMTHHDHSSVASRTDRQARLPKGLRLLLPLVNLWGKGQSLMFTFQTQAVWPLKYLAIAVLNQDQATGKTSEAY